MSIPPATAVATTASARRRWHPFVGVAVVASVVAVAVVVSWSAGLAPGARPASTMVGGLAAALLASGMGMTAGYAASGST